MDTKPHQCPRCIARGKTWDGSDPNCAFYASGSFKADNWNCATMNLLREVAEKVGYRHRINDISLAVIPNFEDGSSIVLSYYKGRGCVPVAYLLRDDEVGFPTEMVAEQTLTCALRAAGEPTP